MYRNSFQRGLVTVLFSGGSNPLGIWEITKSKDGYVERFLDQDIKAMVIQIGGNNVSTTYLSCPRGKQVLGISMPFLVMIVKNLNKYFVFEITILDETETRRRFRVANFQSTTQITPLCTVMPLRLSDGWNQIQFNLAEFTRRAYNKQFVEVQRIRINANIRIRRIYCAERLMPEEELPPEYKIFFPLPSKKKEKDKENKQQQTSVGKKIESKLDVMVAKTDNGSGVVDLAAPPEGVATKRASATPADAEGASRVQATGEPLHAGSRVASKSALEGEPGEEIPAGGTKDGETVLADETPAVETADARSVAEGEDPEVEELAGEMPPADPEPSGIALNEPSAEPEVIDDANASVE